MTSPRIHPTPFISVVVDAIKYAGPNNALARFLTTTVNNRNRAGAEILMAQVAERVDANQEYGVVGASILWCGLALIDSHNRPRKTRRCNARLPYSIAGFDSLPCAKTLERIYTSPGVSRMVRPVKERRPPMAKRKTFEELMREWRRAEDTPVSERTDEQKELIEIMSNGPSYNSLSGDSDGEEADV